jgi:CubicO group peptidase (beta-lactamase class C family)
VSVHDDDAIFFFFFFFLDISPYVLIYIKFYCVWMCSGGGGGRLSLEGTVSSQLSLPGGVSLGAQFSAAGKGDITVTQLLTHTAGFAPDPSPNWWQAAFGCASALALPHPVQDRSCALNITRDWLATPLAAAPGSRYVYSDLSMITLSQVIGAVAATRGLVAAGDCSAQCPCPRVFDTADTDAVARGSQLVCVYEALARRWIADDLALTSTRFMPGDADRDRCAPEWRDRVFQKQVIRGSVSDGNAYASGGVAGHAGLFSTAAELGKIVEAIAFPKSGGTSSGGITTLDPAAVARFLAPQDAAFSSRALGWDTNAAPHGGSNCGTMTVGKTATHTGYTGTLICIDTARQLVVVLLTNRAFPDDAEKAEIGTARKQFTTAVTEAFDDWVADGGNGSGSGSGSGGKGDDKKGGSNATPALHKTVFAILVALFLVTGAGLAIVLYRYVKAKRAREIEREQGILLVDQSFARFRSGTLDDNGEFDEFE